MGGSGCLLILGSLFSRMVVTKWKHLEVIGLPLKKICNPSRIVDLSLLFVSVPPNCLDLTISRFNDLVTKVYQ